LLLPARKGAIFSGLDGASDGVWRILGAGMRRCRYLEAKKGATAAGNVKCTCCVAGICRFCWGLFVFNDSQINTAQTGNSGDHRIYRDFL
jgi:hypothetical protein